jgi:putative ABC transport system ATP-binding protein
MIIKTTNLSKSFRTSEVETIAVNNLNFEVEKGEFVAIMGPSGCGKTTLLNLLGLLDTPTGGVYELNGRDVSKLNERDRTYLRRGKVGFIFQSFNLIDELTVFENIELPLTYLKIKSGERRRIVTDLMRRMEISHRASHFPHQLSGGQQQRVAIARAVVSSPELILADEPTGNLDSKNGVEVMNILSELNAGGTTVVMVTHNRRDAEYAHRIVEMFDGEILSSEQTANRKTNL